MEITAPIFGVRVADVEYVVRPSVYALINDAQGRLALVRAAGLTMFPGGGVEDGETLEEAVCREVLEECALVVAVRDACARAAELVFAAAEATYFEKASTFFTADILRTGSGRGERDHELLWLAPDRAMAALSHGSHRWALGEYRRRLRG